MEIYLSDLKALNIIDVLLQAHNITDVVVSCRETGLEWFEQLLQTLFKPKEDKNDATKVVQEAPKQLVLACQQIVDCLMETVLKSEERSQEGGSGQSHRIVACLTTTFLFAKIRPQLLINHVQTLQPYLNIKCFTQGDYQIISNVARTLELVVPLIEHPSQIFLSQLEEASVKLILQHDKTGAALFFFTVFGDFYFHSDSLRFRLTCVSFHRHLDGGGGERKGSGGVAIFR